MDESGRCTVALLVLATVDATSAMPLAQLVHGELEEAIDALCRVSGKHHLTDEPGSLWVLVKAQQEPVPHPPARRAQPHMPKGL